MDEIDKKIMLILSENPTVSLTKIGKIVNLSHVAIRKRINKLFSSGLVKLVPGFNLNKMKYKIAVILAEVGDPRELIELFNKFRDCPRMIFLGTAVGSYNVFSMMSAEDDDTLNSVINFCSFRTDKLIRKSEVSVIYLHENPKYIPIELTKQELEIAPCGANCKTCPRYKENKCRGCPATIFYRDSLNEKRY